MTKPIRVQLSRKKGWRMPPNTVSVARPGKHGNPFRIGDYARIGDPTGEPGFFRMSYAISCIGYQPGFALIESRENAVEFFEAYVHQWPEQFRAKKIEELRGKNLACWCPLDQPCHADVLLELANREVAL